MAWITPKTNWQASDVVGAADMNRIEGNINSIENDNRTIDPTRIPSSNTGLLKNFLDWFANRIKAITGKTNWYDTPDITLATLAAHKSRHASGGADALTPADIGAETPAGAQAKVDNHAIQTATLSTLGHVKHAVLTATLTAASWTGTTSPYSQSVTVSGILATDTPIIDIVMSGTYSTDEARIEAWGYIYRAVTANGSITFYATEKPTVSLPIQIKVVR